MHYALRRAFNYIPLLSSIVLLTKINLLSTSSCDEKSIKLKKKISPAPPQEKSRLVLRSTTRNRVPYRCRH